MTSFKGQKKRTQYTGQSEREDGLDENQGGHQNGEGLVSNWRHLVNF